MQVLFEDSRLLVKRNEQGEIVIVNKERNFRSDVRIANTLDGNLVVIAGQTVDLTPTLVSGCQAFEVRNRS